MPGKSQYVEAPMSLDTFVQSVKDAFEFVGYDVNQTTDDSMVFDSEYWRAKQTTSVKNKVPESEQLVFTHDDYIESIQTNTSSSYGVGMDWYVTQNTDTSYPFKLINNLSPRVQEWDGQHGVTVGSLKQNTNYTVSFWARAADLRSGGRVIVNSGFNQSNFKTHKNNTDLGEYTTSWQRFSYTVNTAGNTSIHHRLGGGNTWFGVNRKNFLKSTEDLTNQSYWYRQSGVSVIDETLDVPVEYKSLESGLPRRATFNNGTPTLLYQTSGALGNVANRTFTFSVYAKHISGTPTMDFSDGSMKKSTTVTLTSSGWTRYSVTYTFPADAGSGGLINVHFGGSNGDSVLLWGAQLEEGPTMTEYTPYNRGEDVFGVGRVKTYGNIQYAGLQIEEGIVATTYEPVRVWHFKPHLGGPLSVSGTIKNQNQSVYYNIPGGVEQSFISSSSQTAYGSGVILHSTFSNIVSNNLETKSHGSSYLWRRIDINESNGTVYTNSLLEGVRYPSESLRVTWGRGNGSTDAPIGNVFHTFTHGYSDTGITAWKREFTIFGIAFKLSTPSRYVGSTRTIGLALHQKTPGNGRRKITNIFFKEDATRIYMSIHTPVYNLSTSGIAESSGSLVVRITPPYTINSSYNRNNGAGWWGAHSVGMPISMEFAQGEFFDKNSDTFSFVQGGADGFVYALNVNSSFKFKYLQADLVNSPMNEDNGTMFSKYAVGSPVIPGQSGELKTVKWYAHGPLIGENSYGTGFGNNYRLSNPQGVGLPVSRFPEVFGDNVDFDATFNSMITQCYCIAGENSYVSTRGQIKNFFMVPSSRFLGVEGDLIIAEDGSRYFGFQKTAGQPNMSIVVKV